SENARLKDQVLAFQSQNRDYADRAVDDARRLAIEEEAIERLEHSVQVYQDERTKLEAAYRELRLSLRALRSAAEENPRPNESDRQQDGNGNRRTSARSSKDITAVDDE